MARKSGLISILQCGERAISCLRVRPSAKGVEVHGFHVERVSPRADDGSLQAALTAFAEKHRIAGDSIHTVLPRHDMTARIVTLPSQDESEIARMVRLSAEEFVPYALEDLVVGQCVLHRMPDGNSRVLAVLAHRDVIEAHVNLLRGAGLEPEDIHLSSACIASVASAVSAAPGAVRERYAIVNLAPGGLEALIMNGTRLEYTRGVASTQDWSLTGAAAHDAHAELAAEVRASLAAHRRESEEGVTADTVYLCSDWTGVDEACDALTQETGLACSPASFAQSLITQGAEKTLLLPLSLLGAALVAQGRAKLSVSLIPETLRTTRARATAQRLALRAGALVGAILIGLGALFAQTVYQRTAYLAELSARIAEVESTAKGVSAKQKQLKMIQDHLDRSGGALELLAKFSELAPNAGLTVTRAAFKRDESFVVEGRTDSIAKVNQLAEDLRRSGVPQFEQTISGNLKQIQELGQPVQQYEIKAVFPAPEETPGASGAEEIGGE